jgi:hypothetical protein
MNNQNWQPVLLEKPHIRTGYGVSEKPEQSFSMSACQAE